MNRRDLLQRFGYGMGLSAFSPIVLSAQRAFAQTTVDPNARLVLIRAAGAMDSTLGLHPVLSDVRGIAEQDLFLGYGGKDMPLANVGGTQISLGPAAAAIAPFAKQMALVRGIYVGPKDLGHPFAEQHMASGRTQESAPYWTAYVGREFSDDHNALITNGAIGRGDVKGFRTLLTSILNTQVPQGALNSRLGLYKDKNLGAQTYLNFAAQSDKITKFNDALSEARKDGATVEDADLIFASLYSGLGRVAQWDIDRETGDSMDTHTNHAHDHLPRQKNRWERIAKFLAQLQKADLLKDTLVVVVTEFNRTPGLNDNGGKDHNYSDNAVALFGRGLNGGTVVGDRSLFKRGDGFPYAYWAGQYLDYATGKSIKLGKGKAPGDGVDLIRPEDLWKSVALSLDEDLGKYTADSAKKLPKIFG